MHLITAAETTVNTTAVGTTSVGTTTTKKTRAKKGAAAKHTKKAKKPARTHTTTAGSEATKTTAAKKTTKAKAKKQKTARTKTTTAGKKTPKSTKAKSDSRRKKATYGDKKTTEVADKKTKRTHRKTAVKQKHKQFNLSKIRATHTLGKITEPTTKIVNLSEPARGYKNANYIQFTIADNKPTQVLFRSHELTTERAHRKHLEKLSHVGQKSVEIYAGNNASSKGLQLIGEFALLNANLKGRDDLQVAIDPSGYVAVSGKDAAGRFAPITEFSVNQ